MKIIHRIKQQITSLLEKNLLDANKNVSRKEDSYCELHVMSDYYCETNDMFI
ncbi:hypothetical protein [Eudoraea chungangensis]|uniref:hypothetical protein n=1 Tax=Eudoraea chungangensis TaxID=1481905 RepID=UPI0023ECB474|nr:hypothetical protein [Eudoraea chungangensis]